MYSYNLFLISSASVRSIPFLSFIELIFAWNVPLVSLIFLRTSLVLPIIVDHNETQTIVLLGFSYILCPSLMCVLSHSVVSDSLWPHRLQPSRLLCPWGFPRQEYWSGFSYPPPKDLPNPGIKPRSPALQVDSLPTEPPGKPKNTGVSSLSLLQRVFLAQDLNQGSPTLQADSLPAWATWEALSFLNKVTLFLNFHKYFKNLCMNQHFASLCDNSTAFL